MKPETNTSNIVARLQTFVESDSKPDDITAAGLRKEIKDLIAVDPSSGYMVYGIYHCVFENHDESISNHERSLSLSSASLVYTNYLTSLSTFGESTKAFNLAVEAVKKHPGDIGLVGYAARLSYDAGRLNKVMEFYDLYKKLTVNQENNEPKRLTDVVSSASKMLDEGVDVAEFTKVIELSESVLLENKVKSLTKTLFLHDGEFSYILRTDASPEVTAKLNDELCKRLAALKNFIVYNFSLVFMPTPAQ